MPEGCPVILTISTRLPTRPVEKRRGSRELASSGTSIQVLTSLLLSQMAQRANDFELKGNLETAMTQGTWDRRPEPNPRNIQQITGFDCNNNYIRSGECELLVQCLYGSTLVEVCSISAGIRETRWQNLLSGPPESRGTRSFLLNYDEDLFESELDD